jgi:hypothetical protein
MSFTRIIWLLQVTLFLLFCVVGTVFAGVDVYWYGLLDNDARWRTIIDHHWTYESIWYLDCFTFAFMYLWIAVSLMRFVIHLKSNIELLNKYAGNRLKVLWRETIYPRLTVDTGFKLMAVIIAYAVVKHAFGKAFDIPVLRIISDIRPMANIWYDIIGCWQWLYNLIW